MCDAPVTVSCCSPSPRQPGDWFRRRLVAIFSVTGTQTVEEKAEMAKFELYKDAKGEYRWRLKSGNGQIIATGGEGYTSKAGAINGIEAVKRDAGLADVDEQE
jgi:uncharacterized protein